MEGLDKFREAFEAYPDNYVIIGGTASEITLRDGDFHNEHKDFRPDAVIEI